jgi:hypothetical protein
MRDRASVGVYRSSNSGEKRRIHPASRLELRHLQLWNQDTPCSSRRSRLLLEPHLVLRARQGDEFREGGSCAEGTSRELEQIQLLVGHASYPNHRALPPHQAGSGAAGE